MPPAKHLCHKDSFDLQNQIMPKHLKKFCLARITVVSVAEWLWPFFLNWHFSRFEFGFFVIIRGVFCVSGAIFDCLFFCDFPNDFLVASCFFFERGTLFF